MTKQNDSGDKRYFENSYLTSKEELDSERTIIQKVGDYTLERRRHQWQPENCIHGIKHRYEIRIFDGDKPVLMHRARSFERSHAFWFFRVLPFVEHLSKRGSRDCAPLISMLKEDIRLDYKSQREQAITDA